MQDRQKPTTPNTATYLTSHPVYVIFCSLILVFPIKKIVSGPAMTGKANQRKLICHTPVCK